MKTRVKANAGNNTPKAVVKKPALKSKTTAKSPAAQKRAVVEKKSTPTKVVKKPTNVEPVAKKAVTPKKVAAKGKKVVSKVEEEEEEEPQDEEIVNEEEEENAEEMEQADEEHEEEENEAEEVEEEEEAEEVEGEEEEEDDEIENGGEEQEEEEVEADNTEAPEETTVKETADEDKKTEGRHNFSTDAPAETVPEERLVYLKNVPEKTKVLVIFHMLKNCGLIANIYKNTTESGTDVTIAFESEDSAINAMLFMSKLTLKGSGELSLSSKAISDDKLQELSEKTVVLRNINPSMSIDEVKKTFSDCGTILYASFIPSLPPSYIIPKTNAAKLAIGKSFGITYKTKDGAECALEKHNNVLGGRHIWVNMKNQTTNNFPECTIKLGNQNKVETFSVDTLEQIFGDCGEIHYIEILCTKALLATVTFKDKESVQKAMALNETTVQDLPLKISTMPDEITALGPEKTTICVYGYYHTTKEAEIQGLFERYVGGIKSIAMKTNCALITFDTVENYCNSFKLDEAQLKGHQIFVEPHSKAKFKRTIKRDHTQPKSFENRKRKFKVDNRNNPVQNVSYGPSAKRPRNNFTPGGGPQGFVPRNNFNPAGGAQGFVPRNNQMQNAPNKRPHNNFPPAQGFVPRNNFQGNQNSFNPRNNFQGNQNNFPPRNNFQNNQQPGGPNNFQQNGPRNFYNKQFNGPAANGQNNFNQGGPMRGPNTFKNNAGGPMRGPNTFNSNAGGPRKFNNNKPGGGPKNFIRPNNV